MDIGDPLWFLNIEPERSTSSQVIKTKPIKNDCAYNDLELVIANIIKKQIKNKKDRRRHHIKRRASIHSEQKQAKNINTTPNEMLAPLSTTENNENVNESTMNVDKETIEAAENLNVNSNDELDVRDCDSTDEQSSSDNATIANNSSESDDILSLITPIPAPRIRSRQPRTLSDIKKFKTVINKLEHRLDRSIRTERNHTSRKYKTLVAARKILKAIKYPVMFFCTSVGLYYMAQPYSQLLTAIAANSTGTITTLAYSIVSAFGR